MAENSIYNVGRWETGTTYLKNNIAYDATTFPLGSSAVKSIKYYYSLRDSNQGNALPTTAPYNNEYWGGFSKVGDKSVPEFLWLPSYNNTVNHTPRVSKLSFGNGYEQRMSEGLFSTPISFSASFEMRNEAEATAIVHFLKARKGVESFTVKNLPPVYKDVPGGRKKLFTCSSFSSNFVFFDNYSVKATFVETNH